MYRLSFFFLLVLYIQLPMRAFSATVPGVCMSGTVASPVALGILPNSVETVPRSPRSIPESFRIDFAAVRLRFGGVRQNPAASAMPFASLFCRHCAPAARLEPPFLFKALAAVLHVPSNFTSCLMCRCFSIDSPFFKSALNHEPVISEVGVAVVGWRLQGHLTYPGT